jgi:hypothetical protein
MKLNSSLVISSVTFILSIFLQISLWFPLSVVLASLFSIKTSTWVKSERLGSYVYASMLIKFACSLVMFYAAIGQYVCIFLIIKGYLERQ